jgi:hypothetical protein
MEDVQDVCCAMQKYHISQLEQEIFFLIRQTNAYHYTYTEDLIVLACVPLHVMQYVFSVTREMLHITSQAKHQK